MAREVLPPSASDRNSSVGSYGMHGPQLSGGGGLLQRQICPPTVCSQCPVFTACGLAALAELRTMNMLNMSAPASRVRAAMGRKRFLSTGYHLLSWSFCHPWGNLPDSLCSPRQAVQDGSFELVLLRQSHARRADEQNWTVCADQDFVRRSGNVEECPQQ